MTDRKSIGKLGEELAAKFLEDNGYIIIERNFRSGHLETDIICEDEKYIIFAEVKTRKDTPSSLRYGTPRDAVDSRKRARILECAREYIYKNKPKKRPRIDVLEVYLTSSGDALSEKGIRHIKNAVTNDK